MRELLPILDLVGTLAFALSGAAAGVRKQLDLFGVLVLSFVAANAGGITRDVLIGAVPPLAISDWRYIAVSLVAGMATFYRHRALDKLRSPVLVLDAGGLALFAVSGAQKALDFHLGPVAAVVLGALTQGPRSLSRGNCSARRPYRNRWRHGPRHPHRRDPRRAARGPVRGRRSCRRGRGRGRERSGTPAYLGHDRRRGPLLRASF